MIYLELFLTFLQIGAFSFGGGYGMISLIREKVLMHGWLTEEELLNMIAVAESTPGPIAVNMATFIGAEQGGIPGALFATLGVVLPSFFIILFIASLMRNFVKIRRRESFSRRCSSMCYRPDPCHSCHHVYEYGDWICKL